MTPDNIVLLLGNDESVSSLLDTLHDVIVDYPMVAFEADITDMNEVMHRVGVLNSLYIAIKQLTSTPHIA